MNNTEKNMNSQSPKVFPTGGDLEGAWSVFSFGELLLRLSPTQNWIDKNTMPIFIGGAELNVATALAKWNVLSKYCTALPDNYLTQEIINHLQQKNIEITAIQICGERIGTYYLPQGTDLKNVGVIYDRAYSSFSTLKKGMINWAEVLKDCTWFHCSAVSPALNADVADLCEEALQAATVLGLTISIDLNYRNKLWQYGVEPFSVMQKLLPYCNVVMGNIWAAESLLNIPSSIESSNGKTKDELIEAAAKSMLQIHQQYNNVQTMAYTFRLQNEYFAVIQNGSQMKVSKFFELNNVKDKVGSGDCFMAGLIYGLQHNHTPQQIINFAAAAAVSKLGVIGDCTNQTVQQINKLLNA
jgi:2-dehydro-3-deoxygluconokinase